MLGVLGGVCKVVGVVDGLEAEGQAEVERVLEEFGRKAWGDGDGGGVGERVERGEEDGGEVVSRVDEGELVRRDDEGEVVAREDEGEDEGMAGVDESITPALAPKSTPMAKGEESNDDEITETKATWKPSPSPPKVAKSKSSTKKRSADNKAISTDTKANAAKKKRKKGGDAIDDLFSGW